MKYDVESMCMEIRLDSLGPWSWWLSLRSSVALAKKQAGQQNREYRKAKGKAATTVKNTNTRNAGGGGGGDDLVGGGGFARGIGELLW